MTLVCGNCGQDMPDNSPFTALEIEGAVKAATAWETMAYQLARTHNPIKSHAVNLRGRITQIQVIEKIEPVNMPSDEYARQGETYTAYLIVEVNGTFYRKKAHVDSYGEEEWTGPVTRVNRVEKTIQVWE